MGSYESLPVVGHVDTSEGKVPLVSTALTARDRAGFVRMRFGVGRMRYAIAPGIYGVGNPTSDSPVFVTCNYRMTFDLLRSCLSGIDGWILVLDTKGINVWCAAGKGTFGTDELVSKIKETGLLRVVSHRKFIIPQLGAPGVCAHEVKRKCGVTVLYGPASARDIPSFVQGGMKGTENMRRVPFPLGSRIALIPVELVTAGKYLLPAALLLLVLSGFGGGGYFPGRLAREGAASVVLLFLAVAGGAVLTPIFLPWLPGRFFSVKGTLSGIFLSLFYVFFLPSYQRITGSWLGALSWFLIIPSLSSIMAMNFTGSTPFTSLSGVRKEIRLSLPFQLFFLIVGLGMWISGRFL